MSLRLEMLQVARLAPKLLGEATGLVADFLRSQQNDDGGFKDRAGVSDLYYTVFGLDGLLALEPFLAGARTPTAPAQPAASPVSLEAVFRRTRPYLEKCGDGAGLDLVHLCCLVRCWAALRYERLASGAEEQSAGATPPREMRKRLWERIEAFRTPDGGYHQAPGSRVGTVYGCFLALSAAQDLEIDLPEAARLGRCLASLETADGAWSNDPHLTIGSTNATAAAVGVLRQLRQPIRETAAGWLLARLHPQGGFLAVPKAPIPDLLSTATTLHALAGLQVSVEPFREPCLDFLDSLWTNAGGFHGHWADESFDCEYTYYGLLALGHLSL